METKGGRCGMQQRRPRYRCFLIRCRLAEGTGDAAGWRFTVQQVGPDAARRSFACLKDVEAYLEAELESCAEQAAESAK